MRLVALIGLGIIWLPALAEAQSPNVLPAGSFDDVVPKYVPWAGVDDRGNIHGIDGSQISVDDQGKIKDAPFGPSVAVGDLNGDGKPDLVVADTKGFFWYYPNSGTPDKPAFTQGEIIPIWLGEKCTSWVSEGAANYIPRIQLVNSADGKRLDIVAGTYAGKLFHIPNGGSATQPSFSPTYDTDSLLINTRKGGVLWCNYLAPCFTTAFNPPNALQKVWNLVMGEGTYSVNNIYLVRGQDSNLGADLDEQHTEKVIRGMGLEQLTPCVVDWNNDGKPDILCGDRTGYLNLYANNSTDPAHPTFDAPVHLRVAGIDNFGGSITVSIGDLTGNHLPNLLIGQNNGTILYAVNTGKPGTPVFSTTATTIKGVLPPTYTKYLSLRSWRKQQAYGVPNELLSAVNPQIEPGFKFPDGSTSKYALKFFVWPTNPAYFHASYQVRTEDEFNEHVVGCSQELTLKLNKTYHVKFWVRSGEGISNLRYRLFPGGYDRARVSRFQPHLMTNEFSSSPAWTEATSDIRIENPDDPTTATWPYSFEFRFTGQGTLWVDNLRIQEDVP